MNGRAFWSKAFFRDREAVHACVSLPMGWTGTNFIVSARHPRGTWSRWRKVATLPGTKMPPGESSCSHGAPSPCREGARPASRHGDGAPWLQPEGETWWAEWSLADGALFDAWAFADFCFDATVHDGRQTRRLRSGIARHYSRRVGFYGFGPVGERWSNAEIRHAARAVGGVVVRARDPVALRRLARCVPPGERGMRVFGYSLGGRAAVRWARWLERRGVGIELLVGIDPVDLAARTLTVPPNVRRGVSFYQRNGARIFLLPGPAGRGLTFTAVSAATRVENHRMETWYPEGQPVRVTHEDVPRVVREELIALFST